MRILVIFAIAAAALGLMRVPPAGGLQDFTWTTGASPDLPCRYNVALSYHKTIVTIGGDNGGALQKYDPVNDTWSRLVSMPGERVFAGAAIIDDVLYVIGGMDTSGHYLASMSCYDLSARTWSDGPPMSASRCRLAATAVDGKLYVIGGMEGTSDREFSNSGRVEVYDPVASQWSVQASMPTPRHGHTVVLAAGLIYATGGFNSAGATAAHEAYDPGSDTWERLAPLPEAIGFHGAASIAGAIYTVGGRSRQEKGPVSRYDLRFGAWESLAPMPVWLNRFGMAAIGKHVYVVGSEEYPDQLRIGTLRER